MPDGRLRRSNAWTLDGSETSAAPVSPDGCIRLRSNAGGTAIEVSYDQAAYVTLSGGSSKWNAITAPDGNLALSHVAYTTAFTWSATSGTASDLFTLQNTTDDTGTGAILAINTPGSSNAKDPLTITAQTNTRVQVRYNGDLIMQRAFTGTSGPLVEFRKSRNTLAAPWNVASGDALGTIGYTAFCGTGGTGSEVQLGSFSLIADRDLTAADYGANFRWQTKDSAESIALRNRMWLTSLGYLGIGQNLAVTDVTHRLTVAGSALAYSDTLTQVRITSAGEQPAYISLESSANTAALPQGLTGTDQLIANVKFKLYNTSNALKEVASLAALMDGSNATNPAGELIIYLRASGASVTQAYYDFRTTSFTVTPDATFQATVTVDGLVKPGSAGRDLGATTTAWRNLYIYGAGTYGSHSFKLHGTPTGHRTITFQDVTDTVAVLGTSQTFTAVQTHTADIITTHDSAAIGLDARAFNASGVNAALILARGRGTAASPAALQSGDIIGTIDFYGQYNTSVGNRVTVAEILVEAAAAFSTSANSKAHMSFWTKDDAGGLYAALRITSTRLVGIGNGIANADITAQLTVATTSSATATVTELVRSDMRSSGTAAAGFGLSHAYVLESSTTVSQTAAQNDVRWQIATHASRSAVYSVKTTANATTKERMLLGGYKSLTDNTATDIFNVTFAAASQGAAGGIIVITGIVKKADTTDAHAISETVQWTAGHWNGSSNINVGIITGASRAVGGSGAYGLTYSTTGAGGDTLTFRVSADSTLNVATELYFQIFYGGDAEVTLA